MKKSRLEWKVGLFVFISLAVLLGLIVRFSRSASLFSKLYDVKVVTENVGGLIRGAVVLMSGVPVGTVDDIQLNPGGTNVTIFLRVHDRFKIPSNSDFAIEQAGFLGDRYVSVKPKPEGAPDVLKDGDTVMAVAPFDLQEVARSAAGLLQRVDETAKKLNEAVGRIDKTLFAANTLTNLTDTVANFKLLSDKALDTLDGVNLFVQTNSHPLSASVSNLVVFSEELNSAAAELHEVISTNRPEVSASLKNIQAATAQLNEITDDLHAGKGLAGSILKDEALRQDFAETVQNLAILSSNVTRFGLLYKPKPKNTSAVSTLFRGRTPRPAN